jgi:hypothetical protein
MMLMRWKVLASKFFFAPLACVVLTVALLELLLPLLYRRYAGYFRLSITAASVHRDNAQRFFSSKKFDPELGWDISARNYVATKQYLAQAYGDSFVYGVEVDLDDTWQAHFERLTGEAILNLGVGGYGLDQAVLKFEKYARHSPTRIAILGLYQETFRRALSYYSFYYFGHNSTFTFKPIFVKRGGQFEVIRPPCADAACFMELLSNPKHEVWQLLAHYDYWYQTNKEKPAPGFPHTIKYMRILPKILRERLGQPGVENYYFVNADSLDVVEYLIERFVHDSKDMGMTPVCVMLYSPADLWAIKDGIRFDDEILKFLTARSILYVDTAQYILAQYRHDDRFKALSAPGGHLNGRGNLMVAEALAQGLASMALLGH